MKNKQTFLWYDLETTGFDSRHDRIMQFAAIRTDLDLNEVGERINILVKLSDDILPSPKAIMITGITPQQTLVDGLTEAEFSKYLNDEVFTPGTISVGYNTTRFDDEFIRNLFYRNFYDPYAWQWQDKRSKWDILDVVRAIRALRPDGIVWPFVEKEDDGKKVKVPANKLELLTTENNLPHIKAHDALSDVEATINVAKLLRDKQPKMFNYLFENRDKKSAQKLVNLDDPKPFVYISGRYDNAHEKLTVALPVAPGKHKGTVVVYDLLNDVTEWKIGEKWPIKELNYARCPAIAPVGVLDKDSQKRLGVDLQKVQENLKKLKENSGILDQILNEWANRPEYEKDTDVEGQIYDDFFDDMDKIRIDKTHKLNATELADYNPQFIDERLPELLFRYKARNFPKSLSESEQQKWHEYRTKKFQENIQNYMDELAKLQQEKNDEFLLQELQLWAEAIYPETES